MGLLQEGGFQGISERPLVLQQQLYEGENTLFTDGKVADALIEASRSQLGKDVPLYDQKVLRVLTARRDKVLAITGRCTDSNDSRLFLELAYEAVTEPDDHKKLLTYINLANEVIDRATLEGRNLQVDPLEDFELIGSLMSITEGALILFNKVGADTHESAKKLLSRATMKVMRTAYLPENPSFAYALAPAMDKLLNTEELANQLR